jgi:hypothetical protein
MEAIEKKVHPHRRVMSGRVRTLLAELERWCDRERGRRAQLARHLGVHLSAVSAWLIEYKKPNPAKQPTAEQILAIQEFLSQHRGE